MKSGYRIQRSRKVQVARGRARKKPVWSQVTLLLSSDFKLQAACTASSCLKDLSFAKAACGLGDSFANRGLSLTPNQFGAAAAVQECNSLCCLQT
eukprot:1144133-Pelagomonas_calceolata.AAC.2